ncbi:MAG: MBL fold metallo-hydrolase [Chloroflexota bacterium]|nr:MBL fold metallo-hydrolase [Chloroflexota bacterium]
MEIQRSRSFATPNRHFLTRRRVLAGTTGILAATAAGRLAGAEMAQDAPPAASPVVQTDMTGAVYAFQVGAFSCLAVSDGVSMFTDSLDFVFSGTPRAEAERALTEAGLDPYALPIHHTATLVDTGEHLVLIDTGIGPNIVPGEGLLIENLRGEGVAPEDIDVVVITHGHGDHIGGNADAGGNPTFANARYVMSQEDWDFWTDEPRVEEMIPVPDFRELLLSFVRAHLTPLEDRFELIGYDEEIVPGITSIAAQGHTPGHMALLIESGGERLWIGGDFATHEITLPFPHFVGLPDVEPDRMIETRQRLLGRMADEGGLATFYHFGPFPSVGRVMAEGDAWRWEPVPEGAATPTG